MVEPREFEKKCFERTFRQYMLPFVKKALDNQVILKKDNWNTVFFEFKENNNVTTIRKFEDDLIFAYNIAKEAILDMSRQNGSIQIMETDDNHTIVKIIK